MDAIATSNKLDIQWWLPENTRLLLESHLHQVLYIAFEVFSRDICSLASSVKIPKSCSCGSSANAGESPVSYLLLWNNKHNRNITECKVVQ